MATTHTTSSRNLAATAKALSRLRDSMRQLGLNLSAWDQEGQELAGLRPGCEFCGLLYNSGLPCAEGSRNLAQRIVAEPGPMVGESPCGGCLIGVPVYHRRRFVSAAVACFPIRPMMEDAPVQDLCRRLGLDRQTVLMLGRKHIRHGLEQSDAFLRVLDWMIKGEQSAQNTGEEISTLSDNLSTTYEELSLLYRISGSMSVTQHLRDFLRNVCEGLREVLDVAAVAAVVYSHSRAGEGDFVVVAGNLDLDESQIKLLASTQVAPRFEGGSDAILDNNFARRTREMSPTVRNVVAAPLLTDGSPIGVLMGCNKPSGDFDSPDLKLTNSVANQVAVFLSNSMLYADLQDLLMGVLHALTATIDAKDPYTSGHSQRVALISRRLAEMCGLDAEQVQRIYLSGLLHDIGKIGVPEQTLRKAGRLTDEEFESVKRHPSIGVKILGGIRQLDFVLEGILTHHERPDGRGYPRGLKAEQIPFQGLVVGLADSFDAMTSDRTYRQALSLETVIEEIRTHAGLQFDANLVEKLLAMNLREFLEELRQPVRTVLPAVMTPEGPR